MRSRTAIALGASAALLLALGAAVYLSGWRAPLPAAIGAIRSGPSPVADTASRKANALAEAAMSQVGRTVSYDATYRVIPYPGGDVPVTTGVCTDVLVRAFRSLGLDLQVAVHEDMSRHFSAYPHLWKLRAPDTNIDHRRVPNLETYFRRRGFARPVTHNGADYQPGDVVVWKTWGLQHTGMISTRRSDDGQRFCVVHNMGSGAKIEDMLFRFEITGHYRVY